MNKRTAKVILEVSKSINKAIEILEIEIDELPDNESDISADLGCAAWNLRKALEESLLQYRYFVEQVAVKKRKKIGRVV